MQLIFYFHHKIIRAHETVVDMLIRLHIYDQIYVHPPSSLGLDGYLYEPHKHCQRFTQEVRWLGLEKSFFFPSRGSLKTQRYQYVHIDPPVLR